MGLPLIGRNDRLGQGAPQCFVAAPSEHGFRARVPIRDRPVLVHADNGVGCRLQHRPDARLAVLQRRVRLPNGGKIRYRADQAQSLGSAQGVNQGLEGPDQILTDSSEGAGAYSTDVGDVSWNLPTIQFNAATYAPGTPAHSWQAAATAGTSIGRKGMLVAARTLALSAMELIESPTAIDAAKTSFEKRRAGRAWTTRIAAGSRPPVDSQSH